MGKQRSSNWKSTVKNLCFLFSCLTLLFATQNYSLGLTATLFSPPHLRGCNESPDRYSVAPVAKCCWEKVEEVEDGKKSKMDANYQELKPTRLWEGSSTEGSVLVLQH